MLNQSTTMYAPSNTATRERAARTSRRDRAAWDADALAAVWEGQHDAVDERLAVIEQATHALVEGRLDADLTDSAQRAAHMLAGSLGMFGFGDASAAAVSVEFALSRPTPDRAAELSALLADIRRDIERPVLTAAGPLSECELEPRLRASIDPDQQA